MRLNFLFNQNIRNFYYIYYRYEDGKYIESIYNHEVTDELKKKQDLLNAFKRYTVGFLPLEFSVTQATEITKIHLFKYMISDTCITFRLNNGVIQVFSIHVSFGIITDFFFISLTFSKVVNLFYTKRHKK